MKTSNKQELQQLTFIHSSDIDFEGCINLQKKYTAKPYNFLLNDTTLPSSNLLHFRNNLLEGIYKLIMTIDYKIRVKKLIHNINIEAAKISALSSGKVCKYKHLVGEEILKWNDRPR